MDREPDDLLEDRDLPDTWVHMARSTYNSPGETPREEIWRGLETRLFPQTTTDTRRPMAPWIPILSAASIVLLLGVGVGRWSTSVPSVSEQGAVPVAPAITARAPSTAAVRFATARHLNDAEALLAFVATDARQGRVDRDLAQWGSGLLTQTRLLLDSRVADEPEVRSVLEDLEIVLAQIAFLGDPGVDSERLRSELDLISQGVSEGGVRTRIRSVLPSMMPRLSAADDD